MWGFVVRNRARWVLQVVRVGGACFAMLSLWSESCLQGVWSAQRCHVAGRAVAGRGAGQGAGQGVLRVAGGSCLPILVRVTLIEDIKHIGSLQCHRAS